MNLSVRNGYVVEVWQIWYQTLGFKYCILVEGTEPEMQENIEISAEYTGAYLIIIKLIIYTQIILNLII